MKLISRRFTLYNLFNRRRATTLNNFVSAANLFVGVFVVISIVIIQDSRQKKLYQFETNMEYLQINDNSQSLKTMIKQGLKKRNLNDYYFRIDYTIEQAICQPINIFYDKNALNTIRTMTVKELNGILPQHVKIHLDILRLNGILKSTERIKEKNLDQTEKLICSYILELFVVINFSSYCDNQCEQTQLNFITLNRNLFGDLPNSSLKFTLSDIPNIFHIHNFTIYQSTKYLEKALFIQSANEEYFLSTKSFHSNLNQSSVSMSIKEKSLFIMKKGLDLADLSSIYVSFLSLSIPNLYLRHEDGKIKIAKNDQSVLFQQDATFKLIFDYQKNFVAFQTINLPNVSFISLINDPEPSLILVPSSSQSILDKLDRRFLFKLIQAS